MISAAACTRIMTVERIKKGIRNPGRAARFLRHRTGRWILRQQFGDHGARILDEEWDTLIILDCARYDIFSEVADLPGSLSQKRSLGSVTADFITRNFSPRRAHDLVYLSANPQVGKHEDCLDVHKIVGMWHDSEREKRGQENQRGMTDPKPVIEKAIELHDEFPHKRHIVHLLPPHVPHVVKDGEELPPDSPYRNYEAARAGTVDASVMRDVYTQNLNWVLEEIQPLLDDISGKTVVTSDHGELLGEGMPHWMKLMHNRWGNQWDNYDFGHYSDIDVTELVTVPWHELPFKSRRKIVSEEPVVDEFNTDSIQDQLEALGYK